MFSSEKKAVHYLILNYNYVQKDLSTQFFQLQLLLIKREVEFQLHLRDKPGGGCTVGQSSKVRIPLHVKFGKSGAVHEGDADHAAGQENGSSRIVY